jgi:hypothetical protein
MGPFISLGFTRARNLILDRELFVACLYIYVYSNNSWAAPSSTYLKPYPFISSGIL